MVIRLKSAFILVLLIAMTSSCSEKEATLEEVIVHGQKKNFIELELKVKESGTHDSETESIESIWIYVKEMKGKVTPRQLAITTQRNSIIITRNYKGYIVFDSLNMTINLRKAVYKDATIIDHWGSYEHNGVYKLKFVNDPIE